MNYNKKSIIMPCKILGWKSNNENFNEIAN